MKKLLFRIRKKAAIKKLQKKAKEIEQREDLPIWVRLVTIAQIDAQIKAIQWKHCQ